MRRGALLCRAVARRLVGKLSAWGGACPRSRYRPAKPVSLHLGSNDFQESTRCRARKLATCTIMAPARPQFSLATATRTQSAPMRAGRSTRPGAVGWQSVRSDLPCINAIKPVRPIAGASGVSVAGAAPTHCAAPCPGEPPTREIRAEAESRPTAQGTPPNSRSPGLVWVRRPDPQPP